MKHILFKESLSKTYKLAILIKERAFHEQALTEHYVNPLLQGGMVAEEIVGLSLGYNDQGKAPVKLIKANIQTILKACDKLKITTLLVADTNYFKTLTKERKAEPHLGYIKKCAIEDYNHIDILYAPNYQVLFYNPDAQAKLDLALDATSAHFLGTFKELGYDVIRTGHYLSDLQVIADWLKKLQEYDALTCDIETASLSITEAGIATIAFAWNKHEGIVFAIDRSTMSRNILHRLLRTFFEEYHGTLIYHGGTFDIKVLIYELFMDHPQDNRGAINGIDIMYRSIHCTKILTYLATNSTAGNVLSLKAQAFGYTGNYAQDDIHDTTLIPIDELLEYNLVDACATWFVMNKHYPTVVADQQLTIYNEIMKPSMPIITHMELTGMPMDYEQIINTKDQLESIYDLHMNIIMSSQLVKDFEWQRQCEAMVTKNLLLKRKIKPIEDFEAPFMPSSTTQMQALLYNTFGLPIIDKTDTGAPATGGKTLKKLLVRLRAEHNITDKELE